MVPSGKNHSPTFPPSLVLQHLELTLVVTQMRENPASETSTNAPISVINTVSPGRYLTPFNRKNSPVLTPIKENNQVFALNKAKKFGRAIGYFFSRSLIMVAAGIISLVVRMGVVSSVVEMGMVSSVLEMGVVSSVVGEMVVSSVVGMGVVSSVVEIGVVSSTVVTTVGINVPGWIVYMCFISYIDMD